jgi:hypothetical protein
MRAFKVACFFAGVLALGGCGLLLGDLPENELAPGASASADAGEVDASTSMDPVAPEPVPPKADGTCDADRKACDGQCVSLVDARYGCGTASCAPCALPNARATCKAGACSVGSCEASRADCNGIESDGCEASTSAATSCGGCGISCKAGEVCSEGACTSTCSAGKTYCSGACADTTSDPLHCGACGKACPTVPNGAPTCASGTCGVAPQSPTWKCTAQLAVIRDRCALATSAQCVSCIASTRTAWESRTVGASSYLLGDTTGSACPLRGATDLRFRDLDQDGYAECMPTAQGYGPMMFFCTCQ